VRVFLDTNVLVSAFAARGLCADLFELVLRGHDLVTGRTVLRELEGALRGKLKLPAGHVAEIVAFVEAQAVRVVENAEALDIGVRRRVVRVDAADARVLGEAAAGDVDAFVTGDAALLALGDLDNVRIRSPRGFWDMARATP
jgi:putative PIN family toxin of toxin-antitoxin system